MADEILDREASQAFILVIGLLLIFAWFDAHPKQNVQAILITQSNQATLAIEKLGINAPIIFIQSDKESEIQSALLSGVVHLHGTAMPGEIGNVYIAGHSSDYANSPGHYSKIFSRLPELKAGDNIFLEYENQPFNYMVVDGRVVEADDLSVESQETFGKKLMTLQTSYPIGTALARYVVIAQLLEK